MKKLLLISLALAFFSCSSIWAQKRNLVKINFLSPLIKTFNLQYEYAFKEKNSFQLGVFYTGAKAGDVTLSGFGITPEFRMYLSAEKTAPTGFFLAPFIRYQNFTLKADVLDNSGMTAEGKASFSAIRPGMLIGYQWLFSDIVSFEFFLGPTYSFNSVKVKSDYGTEDDFSAGALNGFGLRSGLTLGIAF
jgi:hypothetical protein